MMRSSGLSSVPDSRSQSRRSFWAVALGGASLSSRAISDVSRAAVFARIVAIPSSRFSCSARAASRELRVGLRPGALFAHEEGDHLELRAVRRPELLAVGGLRLDLAHLAREDGDESVVVRVPGAALLCRARRGAALTGTGHGPPVRAGGLRRPQRAAGMGGRRRVAEMSAEATGVGDPGRDDERARHETGDARISLRE